jgi:tRNA(Ile)-lysidine synthase TilS/MesJ
MSDVTMLPQLNSGKRNKTAMQRKPSIDVEAATTEHGQRQVVHKDHHVMERVCQAGEKVELRLLSFQAVHVEHIEGHGP